MNVTALNEASWENVHRILRLLDKMKAKLHGTVEVAGATIQIEYSEGIGEHFAGIIE